MNSFFWVILNAIGFIVLIFIYSYKDGQRAEKSIESRIFGYLLLSIMFYLVVDTGMFLVNGTEFQNARILNYIFCTLFYIALLVPGLIYIAFCDYKIFKDEAGLKKRFALYIIPFIICALAILTTPMTHWFFYIDEYNIYTRGPIFFVPMAVTFVGIFSVYPILTIDLKRKHASIFKSENSYLYLFPLPPFILTLIQITNYGVLLTGFGTVLAVFLIYINGMQTSENKSSLAVRFRNMHIIQFAVISSVVIAGMFLVIENVINEISEDYASYNSVATSNVLETYLNKEIGVLGSSSRSKALTDWVADEENEEKKEIAYNSLMDTISLLRYDNVYIVIAESGRAYTLDHSTDLDSFVSHAVAYEDVPEDRWVFDLLRQEEEYNLDVDREPGRIRVWLNFKVTKDGEAIGTISTEMEMADIAEQTLRMQLGDTRSRTLIIDRNGYINIDSAYMGEDDFHEFDATRTVDEEFHDSELLLALHAHLDSISGYFPELYTEAKVLDTSSGRYSFATITPIGATDWSVVTLYDASSLFGIVRMLPIFLIIAVMLIVFAYSSNRITTKLIFTPLKQLVDSLVSLRDSGEHKIYGLERNDEIGVLANAIQDYFVEGHFDMLTGIYNRRYMDRALDSLLHTMQRSGGGKLSVLMMDVDYFKKYNDTYGHSEGDECLKAVAKAVRSCVTRTDDFAARYGGEEFVVVLPNTDGDGMRIIAERVLEAVRALGIEHEKNEAAPVVTVSIGGFTGEAGELHVSSDFISKADEALYSSKENGRNRYTPYAQD